MRLLSQRAPLLRCSDSLASVDADVSLTSLDAPTARRRYQRVSDGHVEGVDLHGLQQLLLGAVHVSAGWVVVLVVPCGQRKVIFQLCFQRSRLLRLSMVHRTREDGRDAASRARSGRSRAAMTA